MPESLPDLSIRVRGVIVQGGAVMMDRTHHDDREMFYWLPGGGLETQVEQLDLGLGQLELQLVLGRGPQVSGCQSLGHHASPSTLLTNSAPS